MDKQAIPADYQTHLDRISTEEVDNDLLGLGCLPINSLPLISILIPVYKVEHFYLRSAMQSLLAQSFPNWQACIVFADPESEENKAYLQQLADSDARFTLEICNANHGISSNTNLSLFQAKGEYIGLLDHDDELAPDALAHIAQQIRMQPDVDFIYSDKDCISEDGSTRFNPLFKPDWSPEILYSVNYLTHFCVIRRQVVLDVGGFRSQTDGAQDWDLFLRICERSCKVKHISSIDYHWRVHSGSSSVSLDSKPYVPAAQQRTLNDHLARLHLPAKATLHPQSGFQIQWQRNPEQPVLVLPLELNSAQAEIPCSAIVEQLASSSGYALCTHTLDQSWLGMEASWSEERRAAINHALITAWMALAEQLSSTSPDPVILFYRTDLLDLNTTIISEVVDWASLHPSIGFCGGVIVDEQQRILDSGLIFDQNNEPCSVYYGLGLCDPTLFPSPLWYRNWRAVTPTFVAIKMRAIARSGGLPAAADFRHSFVHMCMNISQAGYRGMTNPHAQCRLARADLVRWFAPDRPLASMAGEPFFSPHLKPGIPMTYS